MHPFNWRQARLSRAQCVVDSPPINPCRRRDLAPGRCRLTNRVLPLDVFFEKMFQFAQQKGRHNNSQHRPVSRAFLQLSPRASQVSPKLSRNVSKCSNVFIPFAWPFAKRNHSIDFVDDGNLISLHRSSTKETSNSQTSSVFLSSETKTHRFKV